MLDGNGTEVWIVVVGMKVSCQKCILPKSSLPTSSIPNLEVLAKPCVLALEGFSLCDNCYASQAFPRLKKILPVATAVLHMITIPGHCLWMSFTWLMWQKPIDCFLCQELSGAEDTTRKDRVWLARGRVCKLVATYWPAFCFYKWKGSHNLDFWLFLKNE